MSAAESAPASTTPQAPVSSSTPWRCSWRSDLAAIRAYLEALDAAGGEHADAAPWIVDLMPERGERAWQLLRALPMAELRYLAVAPSSAAVAALAQQPALGALLAQGRLRLHTLPGNESAESAPWSTLLRDCRGPLIVLAHGLFSTLRHDLRACHYGRWLHADLGTDATDPTWQDCTPDDTTDLDGTDSVERNFAAHYLRGLNSNRLLVPGGAIDVLGPLLQAARGRYLVLASDIGLHAATEIRLGALHVPFEVWRAAPQLPVNFHALALWQQTQNARCAHRCLDAAGRRVLQIALRDDDHPALASRLPALTAASAAAHRDDGAWLRLADTLAQQIAAGDAEPEQAFALWQAADYAPELMCPLATALLDAASRVEGSALPVWRDALRQSCAQHYPQADTDVDNGFARHAAWLAAALGLWGSACELLQHDAGLEALQLQVHCQQMRGYAEEALELLEQALLDGADAPALRSEYRALRQLLQERERLPWFASAAAISAAGELRLEPLGTEHADALLYQYRDPQIGMMARLPEFADAAEVCAWIAERRAEAGRMDYAVMHAESGFVGVVSAHRSGKSGFFHFWIGTDFQGQGLALPALQLLLAQLRRLRLRRLFTTVYPDNFRSLRVIERTGFRPLPDRALPPEEEMPFFCLELDGGESSIDANSAALHDYCARSGGVFVFTAAAGAALAG